MLSNTTSNFSSREAVHYQQLHSNNYTDTISRLSSGKKINNTGDDPSIRSSISNISRDLLANKDLHSDMNSSKALLSSASTYLDEQLNDMSDVRENLIKLQSHNLEDSERREIKLQTRKLLDKADSTANIANYNDLSILNGELKKATFQIGIKSFENIEVNVPSTQTNNLGKVRFETGSRILEPANVQLTFKLSDTEEYALDDVSINSNKGSGIGKLAELINSAKHKIGQQAFYDVTTTGQRNIQKGIMNDLKINGVSLGTVEVEKDDSDNNLINSINEVSSETGVVASKDDKNRLVLNSPDGRGIEIAASSGITILNIDTTNAKNYGKLTLVSTDTTRASLSSPELIGFTTTENFIFSTRDIIEKSLSNNKLVSLGAQPNKNITLDDIFDNLDNKRILNSFSFLTDTAISDLNAIKTNIEYAVVKLTEAQDRIFDVDITLKNALEDKENIDYADEIYNKEKFSNLLTSSTYALNNSLSKQKEIIEELFKSVES